MEHNTQQTVLLVMDMQTRVLAMVPDGKEVTARVAQAIAVARDKKIPVIYVTVGFRAGMPEISVNNKSFSMAKERFAQVNMDEFTTIEPALTPLSSEVVVTKRRVSAFTGSDLEVVLRSWGVQHLVLTGIATSGVVLSTLREAADKDYQLTVIADCCADSDEEVHRVLMTKIFPRQAEVMALTAWEKE